MLSTSPKLFESVFHQLRLKKGLICRAFFALFGVMMAVTAYRTANAQVVDLHPRYTVDLETAVGFNEGGGSSLPFWLHANRYGIYDASSNNLLGRFAIESNTAGNGFWGLDYGVEAISRASDYSSIYLNQAYLDLRAGAFHLYAGRKEEKIGAYTPHLSSGPIMWSGNATPMPKIALSLPEFTAVPYTGGFVEVKGYWAHGWFEDTRYVKNAYLHQKTGYIQLGGDWPIKGFAGLIHNAMWGGTSSNENVGKLPSGWNDYWKVFTGKGGDSDAPGGEVINALGNHLGAWEVGAKLHFGPYRMLLHKNFIFEDGSGLKIRSPEDGMFGVSVRDDRKKRIVNGFLWEFIYTKSQSGPGPSDPPRSEPNRDRDPQGNPYGGRDNYFNNYIYRDGWSYNDRVIGSPLFTYDVRTHKIINNRFVAHHWGIMGQVGPVNYRAFYTYSRNYGRYKASLTDSDPDKFYLVQNSMMVEFNAPLAWQQGLELHGALALDAGELYSNTFGFMLGIKYSGILR